MRITIQEFRKHSLSLALIAGLGLSSGAVMAQDPAEYPVAEARAKAAAEYATRLEALAREAAKEAQEAARIAATLRDQGAATPRGAATAAATEHHAQQSAIAAEEARNSAIEAAENARVGQTVAEDGVNPADGATMAQESARQTEQATRAAVESANRAKAAAVGTAIANMPPPPAPTVILPSPTPQRTVGQQHGPTPVQGSAAAEAATERALIERENQPDVLVTSSPDMNPGADASGDLSVDFSDIDDNNDGAITRQEARANRNLSDDFNTVDTDRNGRLSREELQAWKR
ncbi:MAG: EF-hand domain-containing protein [Pseudomonadota bacterium]|nr:EF-hand domain-containing protein [Pseudomonadota bacterium]